MWEKDGVAWAGCREGHFRSLERLFPELVYGGWGVLHIPGGDTRSLPWVGGATSSQHSQLLLCSRENGRLGRGCLLGTEGALRHVWGSPPSPSLPLPPPSCVWVSSFCLSTSLGGPVLQSLAASLSPFACAPVSQSLTLISVPLVPSVPGSVLCLFGVLSLCPWFLSAFLFRHLCVLCPCLSLPSLLSCVSISSVSVGVSLSLLCLSPSFSPSPSVGMRSLFLCLCLPW